MSDPGENLAPKIKIETDLDFFDKSNMGSIEQQEIVCEKHSNNRQEGCPQCELLRSRKTQSPYIKMEPKLEVDPKEEMEQDIDEEEDDMNVDIDTINISGYIKAEELIIKEEKHDTNSLNNPVLVEADGSVAQTTSETSESHSSATHEFGLYAAVDLEKGKLLGPCEKKINRLESTEGGSLKSRSGNESDNNEDDLPGNEDETLFNVANPVECSGINTAVDGNRSRICKKRKAESSGLIQKRMDEAYLLLNQFAAKAKVAKDTSYLFCKLLSWKLKALDDGTREIAMQEINNLMFRLKNSRKQQPNMLFHHYYQQPGYVQQCHAMNPRQSHVYGPRESSVYVLPAQMPSSSRQHSLNGN